MRMGTRAAAAVLAIAIASGAGGCHGHYQMTNRQFATGAIAVGAVVGLLVLYSMVHDCEVRYGGECRDTNDPNLPPTP